MGHLISSLDTGGELGCGFGDVIGFSSGGVLGCSGDEMSRSWPLGSWDETSGVLTLFPQCGQNREPSGNSFPHFVQYMNYMTPFRLIDSAGAVSGGPHKY